MKLFAWMVLALTAVPALGQAAPPNLTVKAPMLVGGIAASSTQIVFTLAGDLWSVERGGGEAKRLGEAPGDADAPAFSPDGAWLAFSRDTGSGGDVFVMPASGGEARRLTWHPKEDRVRGWTPDGRRILFVSNREGDGQYRLFTVDRDGGAPERLPLFEARQGAFSPDGSRIAYVPFGNSWDEWRFYRGGNTSPIWIARLADSKIEKRPALAGPNANHRFPLWIGETLYFVSDRTGTPNLYRHDLRSGKTAQLTRYTKHGIRIAAAAADAVVFVADGAIHLWDIARRQDRMVEVHLTVPAPELAARTVPAIRTLEQAIPTAGGKELIVSARGEILAFDPATGKARNLTRTPGVAERTAVPSPDGKRIAFFSDRSGEYEIHILPASGEGEPRKITVEEHPSFYRELTWSPDGRRMAFSDKRLSLWVADVEAGRARRIATSPHIGQGLWTPAWSQDGRWLAYSQALANRVRTIFLYDARNSRSIQVTDGKSSSDSPAFDRSGRYLFFTASANARTAAADDLGWGVMSSILARPLVTARLQAVVLRRGDPPPLLPSSGKPHPDARWELTTDFELDGLSRRIVPVTSDERDFVGLAAGGPGVLFALAQEWPVTPGAGDPTLVLYRYTLSKSAAPEKIAANVRDFAVSADGGTLVYRTDERTDEKEGPALRLMATGAPAGDERKPLDLAGLTVEVDPAAEWGQIYRETWRIARDWFYDPGFHGQDLKDLEGHFAAYLPSITRRGDLNELFYRMLAYLSISHLNVDGGDVPPSAVRPERTGLLGADFHAERGRYRIDHIYRSPRPGAASPLLQAPLDQPGVDVREGDYLLAVDGEEIHAERSVYSYFTGKAGKPVTLKVAGDADGRDARTATVVPLPGENTLRRMAWAEANRRRVEELSGGRLAYVYVPNHGGPGYEELIRGVIGNSGAEGIVIDQRWSPGGIVFDSAIELLQRRPIYAYSWREGNDLPMPTNVFDGAKVLIVNRQNGSAAETFALMWKLARLGPIVGTRTYGGGIGGALFSPELIDGGRLTIPNRAAYDPHGTWGIENDGVHPDIVVDWDSASFRAGRDPQLAAAVKAALAAIPKVNKWTPKRPESPKYP
jgi:tricorn protease